VGYLQWNHPLRGEVRPAEFVGIAETTGQSSALSRSLLISLQEDFRVFRDRVASGVRISFGALRHHVLKESFAGHIHELIAAGEIAPDRLELRIAERAYIARDANVWKELTSLGVRLVVDEFGRIVSSLDLLARAPIWGLQLDRPWVTHLESDPAAMKVCQAAINVAGALNLRAIATGVDNEARRRALLTLGCHEGLGDLYTEPGSNLASGDPAAAPTLSARAS
jgi:EAL domain-containing protein (putative c-di-GMP-specific phosphodiesterase class I)